MSSIERYVNIVNEILRSKDEVREYLIRVSRDIIRNSGLAVTYIHLGRIKEAEELLGNLRTLINELEEKLRDHPELKYSNLYLSTLSEYVEATQLLNVVTCGCIKSLDELNVHYLSYIQGLLDLIGELKRYILNLIRLNDIERAWAYFKIANDIYESFKGLDYPEALIPGVRHKVDVARRLLEDLRTFLVDVELRIKLINLLKADRNR